MSLLFYISVLLQISMVKSLPFATKRHLSSSSSYPVKSCSAFSSLSYSCENSSVVPDIESCCFENYGYIMQTQFWDYNESYLDKVNNDSSSELSTLQSKIDSDNNDEDNVFTIHGLWNDVCDGSYHSYCDSGLEISDSQDNITDVIVNDFNKPELYENMTKYWVNNDKSNVEGDSSVSLWEHEYNKHGTCFNTIKPSCFTGKYKKFENTVNYYEKVLEVWSSLPTYTYLKDQAITPSLITQYKLSDIQLALSRNNDGVEVFIGCSNEAIDQIWYYFNVKGNILTGEYKPVDSLTNSTCPENVWYLPK